MQATATSNFSVLTIGTEILRKDVMDQFLRSLGGISTFYASNQTFALESFYKQPVDMVFAEFSFPGGSAQQFIRAIGGLDMREHLYFVLAVAEVNADVERLAAEFGIDRLIAKPFNLNDILELVEKAKLKRDRQIEPWESELLDAKRAERAKRHKEAEFKFEKLIQTYADNPAVLVETARFYMDKTKWQAAEPLLDGALKKNMNDVPALTLYGALQVRKGNIISGIRHLERAQKLSPLNTERAMEIAEAHVQGAAKRAMQVLTVEEYHSRANILLAKVQAVQGDYAAAMSRLEAKKSIFDEGQKKEAESWWALAKKLGGFK